MVSSERSCTNLSEYSLFKNQNIFFTDKYQFLNEKWKVSGVLFLVFFFKILSKFSDFVNSDNFIGKIDETNSIGIDQVF